MFAQLWKRSSEEFAEGSRTCQADEREQLANLLPERRSYVRTLIRLCRYRGKRSVVKHCANRDDNTQVIAFPRKTHSLSFDDPLSLSPRTRKCRHAPISLPPCFTLPRNLREKLFRPLRKQSTLGRIFNARITARPPRVSLISLLFRHVLCDPPARNSNANPGSRGTTRLSSNYEQRERERDLSWDT